MSQVLTNRSVPSVLRKRGLRSVSTEGHLRTFSMLLCARPCPAHLLPAHLLHLTRPWDCGCVAREAGCSSLILQINMLHSRETLREGLRHGKARAFPHTWRPRDRWFTDVVLCSLGKRPSRPLSFPVRKGSQGCQQLRKTRWKRRERQAGSEVRKPTRNVTETQRTHAHQKFPTLWGHGEGMTPKHCWKVTSHGTISAKESRKDFVNGQFQIT